MPEQCPFCKLIENPDQTIDIYETDSFKAFLDINPRAKGHTVIVPKEHYSNFEDIPLKESEEIPEIIKAVTKKAKAGIGADGVSVVINSGESAGQRIPHVYIQVFPRFEGEENAEAPAGAVFKPLEMDQNELSEVGKNMQGVSFTPKGSEPKRKDKKASGSGEKEGENEENKESKGKGESESKGWITESDRKPEFK